MRNLISVIGFIVAFLVSSAAFGAQAVLNWQDNSNNEANFKVDRQLNGGPWSLLITLPVNVTTYTDTTVVQPTVPGSADNVYCYRVYASNTSGNSGFTSAVCKVFAAPIQTVPNAPSNLTTASVGRGNAIDVSWKNNNDKYWLMNTDLERRNSAGQVDKLVTLAAGWRYSYRDTGIPSGETKCYRAQTVMVKAAVPSGFSNESCATAR